MAENNLLHGTIVAVYIAGQERRLVDPPSQVVAGVRTVTTNMSRRGTLPRCRACSLFIQASRRFPSIFHYIPRHRDTIRPPAVLSPKTLGLTR